MEQTPLLSQTLKSSVLHSISYGINSERAGRIIPPEERITYTWSDLNVFTEDNFKSKTRNPFKRPQIVHKHILKHVTGVARPGELLAILGSSGAGKTTLLNALTFRNQNNTVLTGVRSSNGIPLTQSTLTAQSSYVQQDDLFYPHLTVREHLVFHAMVRMDRNIPESQRIKRVNEVLTELSLKKCENNLITSLSGGEKKRLAFAAEVLTDPALMFCDEPTSGLDSFMALNVVQVLKTLAQSGRTVISTIHQPSSEIYALFDKVIFLSEGRIAFQGTPDEADIFFSSIKAPCPHNYNPADYYIELLAIVPGEEESCRQAVNMICSAYNKSEFGEKIKVTTANIMSKMELSYNDFWTVEPAGCVYKNSWWTQFRAVFWRSWITIMKEPLLIKVRLLQTIMISILIGVIYFDQQLNQNGVMNINGCMFIFLTTMTFQNIYAVVNLFCSEFPIFLREHTNGMYRTDVYFLCKTIAEIPLFTVLPVVYISVCYYMIGLNPDVTRFFTAMAILVLVAHVVLGFGYLISCATTSVSMAMSVGPPLIIPFLLFGGFFLNISSIPIYFKWLSYFSWFRYAFEALMINQWSGITEITCGEDALSCPSSGAVVLEIYNFSQKNLMVDITMLVLLVVLFRSMAYVCLVLRTLR